jgi:hypothetical protein
VRLIHWCTFALSSGGWIVSGQNTTSISGKLAPELINTPISAAYVSAMKSGLPPYQQTVPASANASFQFSALPAGTYTICVSAS